MSDVRVLYLCDFDLARGTGKDRATRQKLQALETVVKELRVVSLKFGGSWLRLLSILVLDIKASFIIAVFRPDWLISRGYVGLFSQIIARCFGVVTVREIHANAIEEISLLPYQGAKLWFISLLAKHAHRLDLASDIRIFNHPDLLHWYRSNKLAKDHDFFVYNGFSAAAKSDLSREEAREKFSIDPSEKIIVFIGAASKWHGVEYIVNLQKSFSSHGDGIRVVCGGGDISEFDPERRCLNFSPLDETSCAQLIRAADFCLLPVKQNRVSPGSPLKLYDYMVNQRYVLAQSETNGYSDEVIAFGVGVPVDFTCVESARRAVIDAFDKAWPDSYPNCKASWEDRMKDWVKGIEKAGVR